MFQHNQLIDAIISPILYLLKFYQSKNSNEDRGIGLFFQMPVQIQDSLIVMCKKKAREIHQVKTEKIKIQTAKRLGKKNALKYQQLVQTLAKFKDALWLHQQFTSNRFWKTPKKTFDEFEKISSENKQKKFVKEQILIVYLILGFTEAYHPYPKDGDDYTALQLIGYFVKICLSLTKTRMVQKEAPMEHPRLPELPILGTLASDVSNYYTAQAATNNKLRLKALRE